MATLETTAAELKETKSAARSLPFQLHSWVTTVDHKRLGIMYVASGLIFFVVAGLEAAVMRWQLAFPNGEVVSPETFNRLFTMHGTTMVFLVGMPILLGAANYLVPLMVGARDMAFPRLKRLRVLAVLVRRDSPLLQLHRRRRTLRGRVGTRCRVVRLRAAHLRGILPRSQHGLLRSSDCW